MELSEKELLLKDLSARLPYGVICEVKITAKYSDAHKPSVSTWKGNIWGITTNKPYTAWVYSFITIYPCGPEQNVCPIEECKPYLRSMATMTDDEKTELFQLMGNGTDIQRIDFYNSHYFDYRCLIDKNLALEAPEGMYNISGSGLRVRLKSGEIIEVVKNDDFCAAKYLNKETTEYIFDEDIEEIIK